MSTPISSLDGAQDDQQPALRHLVRSGAPAAEPPIPLTDEGAIRLASLLMCDRDRVSVRSMMNQSLDGAATGADGTSASLGNPTDFFALTVLRALADIIVVGAATVRAEDYRRPSGRACVRELGLRPSGREFPALAVLTRSGDLPRSLDPSWPTYLLTPASQRDRVVERSGFPAARVLACEGPADAVGALGAAGYRAIQVEGGPSVLAPWLADGVVNELVWSTSFVTVGGDYSRISAGQEHERRWRLEDLFVGPEAMVSRYVPRTTPAAPEPGRA